MPTKTFRRQTPVGNWESSNDATLAIGASSASTGALPGGVYFLTSDVPFHVEFGTSPTATTSNMRIPADTLVPCFVEANDEIAVIQATGSGTLYYSR